MYLPEKDEVDSILRDSDDATEGVVHAAHVGQHSVKVDDVSVVVLTCSIALSRERQGG